MLSRAAAARLLKSVANEIFMEATLYNIKGEKKGTVNVPESIFGVPFNADLLHTVVTSMQANARTPVAHTKDRSEVRGGGKKPWQQKGTGRARHGSSRSPIWRGGGITHGPRNERDYSVKINRQQRQKALLVALSRKWKDGEVIFVDSLEMAAPKTADAKKMIDALGKAGFKFKTNNSALIALPARHTATVKSFANMGHIAVEEVRTLNPVNVLSSKYLIIANPESAFETLGKKRVVKAEK